MGGGRILSFWGENDPPYPPLEKGGNQIGSPPFEGGFRGIELELEATPPTLKYAHGRVSHPPPTVQFFRFPWKANRPNWVL